MKTRILISITSLLLSTALLKPALADTNISNARYAKMLDGLLSHSVTEVDVQQTKKMSDVIYIDAREKSEYDASHIKGAIWAGYDDFDLARLTSLNKDQPVVVYCSVGYRSEKITEQLNKNGFSNASNLYGGIFEWVNQGEQVVNAKGETQNVHAFNRKWGKWLTAGEKVYD